MSSAFLSFFGVVQNHFGIFLGSHFLSIAIASYMQDTTKSAHYKPVNYLGSSDDLYVFAAKQFYGRPWLQKDKEELRLLRAKVATLRQIKEDERLDSLEKSIADIETALVPKKWRTVAKGVVLAFLTVSTIRYWIDKSSPYVENYLIHQAAINQEMDKKDGAK